MTSTAMVMRDTDVAVTSSIHSATSLNPLGLQQSLGTTFTERADDVRAFVASAWKGAEETETGLDPSWSYLRSNGYKIAFSHSLNCFMGGLISVNLLVMCFEVNDKAQSRVEGKTENPVYWQLELMFVTVYVFEVMLGIFALHLDYFRSVWRAVDFALVMVSAVDLIISKHGLVLPSVQLVRILRIVRISRAVRIMMRFPELRSIVRGFISAVMTMVWGFSMIVLLLLLFALLSVELIHDNLDTIDFADGNWCAEAFSSVWKTFLMLFQGLVAGDSWGQCTLPVIVAQPAMFIVFASVLVCVQLGLTNLILSTIVDSATVSREKDQQFAMAKRRKEEEECIEKLLDWVRILDTDRSGEISFDELVQGYEANPAIRTVLKMLDIDRDDLLELFCLMDTDNSERVSYKEFVDCIRKSENQDMRVQMMFMKLQLTDIATALTKELRMLVKVVREESRQAQDHTSTCKVTSQAQLVVAQWNDRGLSDTVDFGMDSGVIDKNGSTSASSVGDGSAIRGTETDCKVPPFEDEVAPELVRILGTSTPTMHTIRPFFPIETLRNSTSECPNTLESDSGDESVMLRVSASSPSNWHRDCCRADSNDSDHHVGVVRDSSPLYFSPSWRGTSIDDARCKAKGNDASLHESSHAPVLGSAGCHGVTTI
eukprot:TRINITY_DN7712_c0_g4_i1.p1 TRINITY_DN7712_c0_g4~~TRINITY_DN7712_c0_g4_i1.p1  ORF type:complete len:656 (+),score=94.77 TRINITY_DN7712_c0_g4_i1:32-1999(+)